jgi:hypothetical protein
MNSAHYAALYNQSAALSMLWQSCPALFYEKNFWGNTPPEEAKRYGNEETMRTFTALVLFAAEQRSQIPLILPKRFAFAQGFGHFFGANSALVMQVLLCFVVYSDLLTLSRGLYRESSIA